MAQVSLGSFENIASDSSIDDSLESSLSDPRIIEFSRLCREKIASANTSNEERVFARVALNHVRVMKARGEPVASIRLFAEESFPLLGNAVKGSNYISLALQQGKAVFNQLCNASLSNIDQSYDPFLPIPAMPLIPPPRNHCEVKDEIKNLFRKEAVGTWKPILVEMEPNRVKQFYDTLDQRFADLGFTAREFQEGGVPVDEIRKQARHELNLIIEKAPKILNDCSAASHKQRVETESLNKFVYGADYVEPPLDRAESEAVIRLENSKIIQRLDDTFEDCPK